MKILALTNLFPPHHAGTYDFRCEMVANNLRLRGHEVHVLTSTHGLKGEQRDRFVERRLLLNGAFDHPRVTKYAELKKIELHNNAVLQETITQFQPDVIHVFSMQGLSKSLIFTLRNSRLPTVYDVYDFWIATDIREDAWLRFWNAPSLGFLEQSSRAAMEMSGERGRLDTTAPTRMMKGYERLPQVYGQEEDLAQVAPNSIAAFRFDRLYFCSQSLKEVTQNAGFQVLHGDVIRPGIETEKFVGEIKDAAQPLKKLLLATKLTPESGVTTTLQALARLVAGKAGCTLSICGRGESNFMAELRSFVVRYQLPVEFLTVSNPATDMPGVYQKHDAFLYTAEWSEPFSTTILEAMAAGLPVIAACSGGVNEIMRHGENGLIYTPGDSEELAARVQELQFSPALRVQMAETAQAETISKFNEATVFDAIESHLTTSMENWAHMAS